MCERSNFPLWNLCEKKEKKGHVAQWTRACGYEPQSRGFESLLAQRIKKYVKKNVFFKNFRKKTFCFSQAFFSKNEQGVFFWMFEKICDLFAKVKNFSEKQWKKFITMQWNRRKNLLTFCKLWLTCSFFLFCVK